MRLERVGLKFVEENKRLEQQALAQAAAASYAGAVNAVPHEPTLATAQRVVELARERVEHRPSARRNDPTDLRPTLRQIMAEQRWGPRPALPDPKAAVDAVRAQIQGRIAELLKARANAMAGGPIEAELRALAQQLDALPK